MGPSICRHSGGGLGSDIFGPLYKADEDCPGDPSVTKGASGGDFLASSVASFGRPLCPRAVTAPIETPSSVAASEGFGHGGGPVFVAVRLTTRGPTALEHGRAYGGFAGESFGGARLRIAIPRPFRPVTGVKERGSRAY